MITALTSNQYNQGKKPAFGVHTYVPNRLRELLKNRPSRVKLNECVSGLGKECDSDFATFWRGRGKNKGKIYGVVGTVVDTIGVNKGHSVIFCEEPLVARVIAFRWNAPKVIESLVRKGQESLRYSERMQSGLMRRAELRNTGS